MSRAQIVIENPILNSPFAAPTRHFRFDDEGITDESFDLLHWIESGTVARRQVTIYNDAALAERLEQVSRPPQATPYMFFTEALQSRVRGKVPVRFEPPWFRA